MKLFDIFAMASSNMFRSKLRTILTIIAIFVGSFTISMTLGISSGISSYIDKQLGSIGAKDALIVHKTVKNSLTTSEGLTKYDPKASINTTATSKFESIMLTPDDISIISKQDGILSVEPMRTALPRYIQGTDKQKYEIDVSETIKGMNIDLVAGRELISDKNEILLPNKYVKPLGFNSAKDAVGKIVKFGINKGLQPELVEISAVIAGVQQESIFGSSSALASSSMINTLYDTQTSGIISTKKQYMAAIARFDINISESKLNDIKESLSKKGYSASTIDDEIGIAKQVINAITYVLIFFGAIALLAASFGIINTLFMAVQERTKEIGLMKAMGMSKGKIFLLFSIEAVLIGLCGSVLGVLVSIGLGNIANSIASKGFLKDLPGFDLTVFPPTGVFLVILLIAGIAFLAGTLPARRAANLDPIDALRYE